MDIVKLLEEKFGKENVLLNEPMSKHTSFKTGGCADVYVKVDTAEKLKYILEISQRENLPIFILGNGSNVLVTDKGIRGIVCKIEITKFEIEENGEDIFVTVGSGNKNAEISQKLLNLQIEGFEFASRNPRNNRRSNKNECWCLRQRNERYRIFNFNIRLFWRYTQIKPE